MLTDTEYAGRPAILAGFTGYDESDMGALSCLVLADKWLMERFADFAKLEKLAPPPHPPLEEIAWATIEALSSAERSQLRGRVLRAWRWANRR